MRRLCRSITGATLLMAFFMGCGGSASSDRLVFHFVGWNATGITQKDSVGDSTAQVDIFSHCCKLEADGTCLAGNFETLSPTIINAVVRNEEAANMQLESYSVRVNSPLLAQAGRGPIALAKEIIGGRCSSNTDITCASDAQCGSGGTCAHTDTVVSGLELFDLQAKSIVLGVAESACGADGVCGTADDNLQALAVLASPVRISVTFTVSDDLGRLFEATGGYVVDFVDLETCTGTGGA